MYRSNKEVVPKFLQNEMLDKIKGSHLGIVKCKSRARILLIWICMATDIENLEHPVNIALNTKMLI